jgi:transposase
VGEKRRRFDPDFRVGAVRIVVETGKPVAQVARELGISAYTLHNWVKADRKQGGQGADEPLNDSEREELARLRAERARWEKDRAELEMERDVLIGLVGGRVVSRGGRLVMS